MRSSTSVALCREIAVVGFDDIPAASLASPPLTTVTQDAHAAAEALIDTLIQSIETGAVAIRFCRSG